MITTEPMVLIFLSCCGIMGDRLPCSDAYLWPRYLAEINDFSECCNVPTTGTSVFFLLLQSTYGQSFAFPYKSNVRNALLHSRLGCFQIEPVPSAVLLPVTLNTVYDKSLLILYCSQHPCECIQWPPCRKRLKRKADYTGS